MNSPQPSFSQFGQGINAHAPFRQLSLALAQVINVSSEQPTINQVEKVNTPEVIYPTNIGNLTITLFAFTVVSFAFFLYSIFEYFSQISLSHYSNQVLSLCIFVLFAYFTLASTGKKLVISNTEVQIHTRFSNQVLRIADITSFEINEHSVGSIGTSSFTIFTQGNVPYQITDVFCYDNLRNHLVNMKIPEKCES